MAKRRDDALVRPPPSTREREGYMDPRSQAAWDEWARSVAANIISEELPGQFDQLVKLLGQEVGVVEREIRADFEKQITALTKRIAALERKRK